MLRLMVTPLRHSGPGVDVYKRQHLTCGGELRALGDEIDRMAFELSNMEESRKSLSLIHI